MPHIKVNMAAMSSLSDVLSITQRRIGEIGDNFSDITWKLDWDVKSDEVKRKINAVKDAIGDDTGKLKKMYNFIQETIRLYESANSEPGAESDAPSHGGGGMSLKREKVTNAQIEEAIGEWKTRETLFDSACRSVLKDSESWVHRFSASLYEASDILGTSATLLTNAVFGIDDQDVRDDMMVMLIKKSYMTSVGQDVRVADEEGLEEMKLRESFDAIELQLGGELVMPHGVIRKTVKGFELSYDDAKILCDSVENAQYILTMQREYDRTEEYLSNLEKSAPEDSSVYRACQIIRAELDDRWPLGVTVRQTQKNVRAATNAGITGKVISTAEGMLSAQKAGNTLATTVSKAMIDSRVYLGDGTAATSVEAIKSQISVKNSGVTPKMGDAAGVLMAWNVGNIGGKLLTNNSGAKLEAEKNLMQLYILNAEVETCFRTSLSEDTGVASDVASLYLTTQEAGAEEAADYFIHHGGTFGQGATSFFTGKSYPSEDEFNQYLSSQKAGIEAVRSELGLKPEQRTPTTNEAQTIQNHLSEMYTSAGPGDSLPLP